MIYFFRSKTCLFATSVTMAGVNPAWQLRQQSAACGSMRSGLATCLNVRPLWPTWPPLFLPDLPRSFRARRLLQSVAGRRLAAVRAVLVHPTFEFRDLLAQLGQQPPYSAFLPIPA